MAKKNASVNIKIDNIGKLCDKAKTCKPGPGHCGGFAYFLAAVGTAVYFISTTTGFWNYVLAVLKALVWPAFLMFGLMKFLGM